MDQMASKAKQWIDEKKDPRSARWQAGIEAVMDLFLPDLEKGRLTPVCPLEEKDLPVFKAALETVDLSPGLLAAFLPPSVAGSIVPPGSAEELVRIKKEKPSYKIIILRQGKEDRILCAEISEHAHRPGVDIFQSGALLGSFDYETHDYCIAELTKVVRAHAWEKDKWQPKDHMAYTLNWFGKIEYLGSADVSVDKNFSFFHSPTLVKSNRVDALFLLIYEVLHNRFKETEGLSKDVLRPGKNEECEDVGISACQTLAQTNMLELLNLIKTLNLIDFTSFSDAENQKFKNEFVRTVNKLSSELDGPKQLRY